MKFLFVGSLVMAIVVAVTMIFASIAHGFPWQFASLDSWLKATQTSGWDALVMVWSIGPIAGMVYWYVDLVMTRHLILEEEYRRMLLAMREL